MISRAERPLSHRKFKIAMAQRFRERVIDMTRPEAIRYANDNLAAYLDMEGVKFGNSGHDWTRDGARDLADEELSCWEFE